MTIVQEKKELEVTKPLDLSTVTKDNIPDLIEKVSAKIRAIKGEGSNNTLATTNMGEPDSKLIPN